MHPITAILPTFGYAQYLPELIRSLREQTQPVNLIFVPVIGDTETEELVAEYCATIPNAVSRPSKYACIPHQKNLGFYSAETEYAFLADSDDVWFPAAAEGYLRMMRETGAVVVYPRYEEYDLTTGKTTRYDRYFPSRCSYQQLLRSCYITDCSCVYLPVFRQYLPMTLASGWSFIWDVWKRVAKDHEHRMVNLPQLAFRYRRHPDSESRVKKRDKSKCHYPVSVGRPSPEGWPVVPPERWDRRTVVYCRDPKLLLRMKHHLKFRKVLVHWQDQEPKEEITAQLSTCLHLRDGVEVTTDRGLYWWLYNDAYEI